MNRIKNAILEAKEERRLDFDAVVLVETDLVQIDTRISRNPLKSRNGGEYSFWESIWPTPGGETLMQTFSSCDFWGPEEEPEIIPLTFGEAKIETIRLADKHGVPVRLID